MMRWDQNGIPPHQNPGPQPLIWETNPVEQEESDVRDYLAALARRKWLALLILVAFIGMGVAYILTRRPIYESTAQIVVVVSSEENASNAPENQIPLLADLQALTRSRSANTQVEVISSPEVIEEAYRDIGSNMREQGFGTSTPPSWSYKIEGVKDTDIIRIKAKAYTADAAATFANSIAATYFARDRKNNTEATRKAREYAEQSMNKAQKEVARSNAALMAFKERSGFISPDSQLDKAIERSTELALSLDQAEAEVRAGEQSLASLQNQLKKHGQTVESSRSLMRNPQLASITSRIDELASQRIALLQEYTPESPEVQQINDSIAKEQARLKQVTQTVVDSRIVSRNPIRDNLVTKYASDVAALAASSARANAIRSIMDNWMSGLRELPQQEREYMDLARQVAVAQNAYDTLAKTYRTLLLSEQAVLPKGVLVSMARSSTTPQHPNKKSLMLAFGMVGAIMAVLMSVAADKRDQRAHDRKTVERVTGLETLAMLPETSRRSPRLLSYDNNNPALLESFRMLRNSITLSADDAPPRMIAVTSATAGEGKSTAAVNLATAMALEGRRTLLVDADMRKPALHKLLSLANDAGLSAVLRGDIALDEAIMNTRTDNVFCLPAGPTIQDSPELLNKPYTREVFSDMRIKYDIVILDCPPCAGLSEMQVIPRLADAVLLIVSMKTAIKPRLRATAMSLVRSGAPFVGLVTNRVRGRSLEDGHLSAYCTRIEKTSSNGAGKKRTKIPTS